MEFRGQEEPAEGMGASSAPPVAPSRAAPAPATAPPPGNHAAPPEVARYHECLRNHAAALGGHVVDGCGEFMPGAGAGDDALKCAACGCHRSFHRKDDGQRRQLLLPAPAPPVTPTAPHVPLLLPPPHPYASASHPHYAPPPPPPFPYHGTPSGSGGTTTESSGEERGPPSAHAAAAQGHLRRKRFRTKFTPEQKEQMLAFAERLGWRMQKQDKALVQQFCEQVGVRRQVFKMQRIAAMYGVKSHFSNLTDLMEVMSMETPEKFWVWPVTYSRGFCRLHLREAKDFFS
ncbi:zinc-finger homeodomain protein 6-like [Panicum miliaceum]|uniref:Zinc-finger homeodomain protein 6-like n=1 Tax=Panicum miliaceum TaxID=4540 RepID=A0A3L6REA9_PANMI|nr:zinc-finger homeodomain protein 6-like [Panicum miliaceum]